MPTRSIPVLLRYLMLITCVLLASCAWLMPPPQVRGNKVDPELLKELVPGTSTKADVTAVIGSPTARDTFDDNTWLYISELTQQRIGRTLGELQQDVVVLNFNESGVLSGIRNVDKDAALPVAVVDRTTPSPGTEASFMQQLLGNIGRFSPAGTSVGTGTGGTAGRLAAPRPHREGLARKRPLGQLPGDLEWTPAPDLDLGTSAGRVRHPQQVFHHGRLATDRSTTSSCVGTSLRH